MPLQARPYLLADLVPIVVRTLGPVYPEMLQEGSVDRIQTLLRGEEQAFQLLLPRGMRYLDALVAAMDRDIDSSSSSSNNSSSNNSDNIASNMQTVYTKSGALISRIAAA
jgi:alanyl-tRNA synthetase